MMRAAAFAYGVIAYVLFVVVFSYGIGFVGNFVVPKSIDTGAVEPLSQALLVDVALLALFGVPHSIMARPGFKRRWTRLVPPPLERSTYVLVASLTLALVFWQWRPIPDLLWSVESPAAAWTLHGVSLAGWGLAFISTFATSHLDLTGLRQVYLHWRGEEYRPPPFRTTGLYDRVRHPLMLGLLVAFWATPRMSAGHLLWAGGMTAYIVVGTLLEERDLVRFLGDDYRRYRERVPMLRPRLR